jgi:hypothetical protein
VQIQPIARDVRVGRDLERIVRVGARGRENGRDAEEADDSARARDGGSLSNYRT